MPIWRSSELPIGRPGSPSRKSSSARALNAQSRSGRSSALPALRFSDGDGTAQPESTGTSHSGAPCSNSQITDNHGYNSANRFGNWEASQVAPGWHGASGPPAGESPPASLREMSRQTSQTESRVGTVMPGARANTYTVQYIGIANGELGILSQKQKLTIPVTVPGTANGPAPSSNVVLSRRQSRTSGSSAASTRAPKHFTAGAIPGVSIPVQAAAAAAVAAATDPALPQAAAAGMMAAVRPPLPPSQPTSAIRPAPLTAVVPDPGVPSASLHAYDAAAVAGGLTDETDDESPGSGAPAKLPSLISIVDDAYGQVKVISECFYSRALHSRTGPRDRHTRHNRPMGPQVQDMEPVSTALPGCFGHRAPSAGGFPGWKLTAPSTATNTGPRRTYSGSGSGPGFFPGRQQQPSQQRASSAQPLTGSTAATAVAGPATAAVAAAAAGSVSGIVPAHRASDAASSTRSEKHHLARAVGVAGGTDVGGVGGEDRSCDGSETPVGTSVGSAAATD
ncbi:hypothetical protein Vretimale_6388 [Volvox reticuliferus]|uniref:Uncharacterized protein n=1 Tax=Volvox reticuliferus TaxID=1737510 RepID=A0A8J4FV19_9CHLO|nr:hypothetical protein Vretifemale_16076 [Volvox reticuliferus]GIM01599.1 hypothetical protein Vretimale_6388 [Volvox reticuliferus]